MGIRHQRVGHFIGPKLPIVPLTHWKTTWGGRLYTRHDEMRSRLVCSKPKEMKLELHTYLSNMGIVEEPHRGPRWIDLDKQDRQG